MLHYAWGHASTGDMAIAPGMIALIKKVLPTAKISLLTLHAGDRYVQTQRYLQSHFPDVQVYPDFFAPMIPEKDPAQRWWRFMNVALNPAEALALVGPEHREGARAWRDADLRLYTPSMQLTYHPKGGPQGLRFWLPVVVAQRLGLSYSLWAQSFGEIAPPGMEMLKQFLDDALMVTTRDTVSLDVLREAGVSQPAVAFSPDTTLYFDRRDDAWAASFLAECGLAPGEFLLVLPRTYGFWGAIPSEESLSFRMGKVAHAIESWVRVTGKQVLIGYELPREKERTATYLWPLLSESAKSKSRFFQGEWTAEAALSVYASARAILSMERYAVLFALTAGVPVLHPTTRELGFRLEALDHVGLADWHVDIDTVSAEGLASALIHMDVEQASASKRAVEARHSLRETGFQALRTLVERISPGVVLRDA